MFPASLVALAIVCAAACGDARPTESSSRVADILNDGVSMRIDPLTSASEVEFLNQGTQVKVVGRTDEKVSIGRFKEYWYRVRLESGLEGWVYGSNLSIGSSAAAGPVRRGMTEQQFREALVGQWWEVRTDGTSGYRRLYLWPDGSYKYAFGDNDWQEGKYVLEPEEQRMTFDPPNAMSDWASMKKVGTEFRLFSESEGRKVSFRRLHLDPDAPEPGAEEETENAGEPGEAAAP